jgi:hypothetical protein
MNRQAMFLRSLAVALGTGLAVAVPVFLLHDWFHGSRAARAGDSTQPWGDALGTFAIALALFVASIWSRWRCIATGNSAWPRREGRHCPQCQGGRRRRAGGRRAARCPGLQRRGARPAEWRGLGNRESGLRHCRAACRASTTSFPDSTPMSKSPPMNPPAAAVRVRRAHRPQPRLDRNPGKLHPRAHGLGAGGSRADFPRGQGSALAGTLVDLIKQHFRADQPAGAQRRDRSGARRRSRARLRRGGRRGAQALGRDRQGRRPDQQRHRDGRRLDRGQFEEKLSKDNAKRTSAKPWRALPPSSTTWARATRKSPNTKPR